MCASYEARFNVTQLVDLFSRAQTPLDVSGGLPNLAPIDEIRPTDSAIVVLGSGGTARLATLRFGFPPPKPKAGPIINLRSEGRSFENRERTGRCLVPVSGFYEFTGTTYPKTRWIFRDPAEPFLALAGIWRAGPDGQPAAFALLTTEPGPDIAPYHDRGVVAPAVEGWAAWLFAEGHPTELVTPTPAGRLIVTAAPRPAKT